MDQQAESLIDRVHRRLRRNVEEAKARFEAGNEKTPTDWTIHRIILEAFEEAVAREKAEKDGGGE